MYIYINIGFYQLIDFSCFLLSFTPTFQSVYQINNFDKYRKQIQPGNTGLCREQEPMVDNRQKMTMRQEAIGVRYVTVDSTLW